MGFFLHPKPRNAKGQGLRCAGVGLRARARKGEAQGVSFFVGCHAVGLRFEEAAVGLRSEGAVGLRSEACGRSKV